MASVNNIPREIQESFREVFDRRIKLSIKRLVRQEVRTDKLENKILAFSPCRLYVMSAKVPCRHELSFHFLDIQAIESRKPNQMVLTIDGKTYTFFSIDPDTEEIDHMITHIGKSLKQIFPAFPFERLIAKIDVVPAERIKTMYDMMRDIESKDQGPCGGFTMMYACMCDYYNLTFRDEVAWDVDTIYLSQDTRELCLRDFDHLNGKDLVPIIAALEHNSWFTKLNANNVKLTPEALNEILKVMKRNAVIEELCLSNCGIRPDFIQKLSVALLSNNGTQLTRIDISNNVLEDKSVIQLMGSISNLSKGLVYLDLSKTGLTSKGLNRIAELMLGSENIPSTLKTLILADNNQRAEDLTSVCNFLAQSNVLSHLNLSSTDCALDTLSAALVRGCVCNLTHLDLSNNIFTHRKMKDVQVPQSWKQFFVSAFALQYINLSGCRLPPEAVKELLLGIACNKSVKAIEIDLSSNDLQAQGAHNIGGCLPNTKNISSLDVSNNGFDQDLKYLLHDLTSNTSLKHLAIGRNFHGVKPKYMANVLDPLIQIIQDEECTLQSLSLADSKLKADTAFVINALGSNTKLEHIDISGNLMGDLGARMLGKALQINTKLRSVLWDKNGTTAQGFEDIAEALEKNFTLRKMPFPVNDAAAAMKLQPERTELALQKIESLLQRNHSPGKIASDQAYRLQQGFLISSTQQMVDRLVVQVQDTVNALSMEPNENFKDSIERASSLIKDADNSKQLLPRLQDIAIKSQNSGNAAEVKLQEMTNTLREVMEKQIKKTVSEMLECTKKQCSAVMADETFHSELNTGCEEKSSLPRDFTKLILDGVGTDVFNKLSELNLAVAAHISDQVVDEVIDSLTCSHKTLTNHLNLRKSGHYRDSEHTEKMDTETEKSDDSKNLSPSYKGLSILHASPKLQSKRKSLIGRKRRPQSVIDRQRVQKASPESELIKDTAAVGDAVEVEVGAQDCQHLQKDVSSSETLVESKKDVVIGVADVVDIDIKGEGFGQGNHVEHKLTKVDEVKEKDTVSDLDVLEMPEVPKLEHLNKARPKRPKRVAVTRPVAATVAVEESQDDGLNVFFVGKLQTEDSAVPKRKDETDTALPAKAEVPKPEVKKRGWFSKDKDKGAAKEKETKKDRLSHSGITAGISNFFGRKSAGKPAELVKEKKLEPEREKVEEQTSKHEHFKVKESKAAGEMRKKEVTAEKVSTSDKSDEDNIEGPSDEEKEEAVPKLMSKVPKIGLGGNLMAEMKLKQEKKITQRTTSVTKKPPTITPEEEKIEANNNVIEKPLEERDKFPPKKALLVPSRAGTLSGSPNPATKAAISPKRPTVPVSAARAKTVDSSQVAAKKPDSARTTDVQSVESAKTNAAESVQKTVEPLPPSSADSVQPKTADSAKISTSDIAQTSTSDSARTSTSDSAQTSTSESAQTSTSDSAQTSTSDSAQTSTSDLVQTSTSDSAWNSTSDSARTSTSDSPRTSTSDSPLRSPSELATSTQSASVSSASLGKVERKPESKAMPPPIVKAKPKPPILKPKPRGSARLSREFPAAEASARSCDKQKDFSAEKKSDSEIVCDSATLRLTVKQKIERLSKSVKDDDDVAASPPVKPKIKPLRNIIVTETCDSHDESKSENVTSVASDNEKTDDNKSIQSQSKSSGETTPDSVESQSSSDNEEKNERSAPVAAVDEIMV